MVCAVAEIAIAEATVAVVTGSALLMAAGHFAMVTVAEVIAANAATVVLTFLAMRMSAGAEIVGTLAEISVTRGAGLVVAKLAGGMSAGKGFMATLAKITLTVGAGVMFALLAGSVSTRHFLMVSHRKVTVTHGAILNGMGMVVTVAEIAVAIGAFSVSAYRGITAADEALDGFDDGRTDMGGKDGDIFGVATGDVDQVACNFILLAVFKGVTVGHKRHHSTVHSFNGNIQIVAADGNGGGEGNVGTLGEVLELCHKKVFICLCTVDRLIQLVVLA